MVNKELFFAFEVKSSNKDSVTIFFTCIRFDSRIDTNQFPIIRHHCIDFAVNYCIVGSYVFETNSSHAIKIKQFDLFVVFYTNVLSG